jgi:hypothetical protein
MSLLVTKPTDSLFKKNVAHMVNWVGWGLEAFADSIASDVGDTYQGQVTVFVVAAMLVWFAIPIIGTQILGLSLWKSLLAALCVYLFLGALYHLNNRQWKM